MVLVFKRLKCRAFYLFFIDIVRNMRYNKKQLRKILNEYLGGREGRTTWKTWTRKK